MYEKGNRAAKLKGHQIDLNITFNLLMFCDILQTFKQISDYLQ